MRKLLNDISKKIQTFIVQRDDLALVVGTEETVMLPLLKIIEGLEETSSSDLYWVNTDTFSDSGAYAEAVVSAFKTRHEAIRLMMEKEGMAPWPPIPPLLLSGPIPPAERLRELAAFTRELLPVPNGGTVVWVFLPIQIADPGAFALLMEELLHHEFPFPWSHHLRFIIREDPHNRALKKRLATAPRIQWYDPDLGMDALKRSMDEEIADEELPLAERLHTLLVMAGIDFAFMRFPEALGKYVILLQYHAPLGNHALAAVALNGMGEVYEKMGDITRAEQSYEAALVPASHGDNPPIPVLLNIVLNLANLRQAQERWEDAEAYFDMAQQLATVNRDASLKIRSLENRGICQQQQGKLDDACTSWNDGLVMAAQLQDVAVCRGLLERLRQLYADTHQTAGEREVNEYLAAFDS